MDLTQLTQALSNTLHPELRAQAEAQLEQVHKAPEFTHYLLQVVLNDDTPLAVQQASSVYLKNMVYRYWKERETVEGEEPYYCIPEATKQVLRANLVEAIIRVHPLVRSQLCVLLEHVIKLDFPDKWTGVVDDVLRFISSNTQQTWLGGMLSLYQLAKKFKFREDNKRVVYLKAMSVFLPLMQQQAGQLLTDVSSASLQLQRIILKIFYALIEYHLPLSLLNENTIPGWIHILHAIIDRDEPKECAEIQDEEDRAKHEFWKSKKWALSIIVRIFERYGSPHNVDHNYQLLARYYMKMFNDNTMQVLLKQLQLKRSGQFITPKMLHLILNYLKQAVDHAASWKLLKPNFQIIFQELVFPLLCYSDKDDQLWHDDPYEFIRLKYDVFVELESPVIAGVTFVQEACKTRKNVLDQVLTFCLNILYTPEESRSPRLKDGALHTIGSIATILLRKKSYKQQIEQMLATHVFSEFQSSHGYLRARACWCIQNFSDIQYSSEESLRYVLEQVLQCLLGEQALPIKVEAAIALQQLIKSQALAQNYIENHVNRIIQELLVVIKETENDDLTGVLEELIDTYPHQIGDVAVGLCQHLATAFNEIFEATQQNEEDSYKALTALGIMGAIQSLVKATINQPQLLLMLEGTMANMIAAMLKNGVMDFYDELLNLLYLFTCVGVSDTMWCLLPIIYEMFQQDGSDFFNEIMPVLSNYVRVGGDTFLTEPKRAEMIVSMCSATLQSHIDEDAQRHACKMLEILVLEHPGKLDQLVPSIVQCALDRLTKTLETPELKTLCIQVVVAALYANTTLVIELLETIHFPNSKEPITDQFVTQWVKDADQFQGVHDKKMSVLGYCALLQSSRRPRAVQNSAHLFVPAIIIQLKSLVQAYQDMAKENSEDESSCDDDVADVEELSSDEDHIDEEALKYMKTLRKKQQQVEDAASKVQAAGKGNVAEEDEVSDDDDVSSLVRTSLEMEYVTAIDSLDTSVDEFYIFKSTLESLSANDPSWYQAVTGKLTADQIELFQSLMLYADQRRAQVESQRIEAQGGYQFTVTEVPQTFQFT